MTRLLTALIGVGLVAVVVGCGGMGGPTGDGSPGVGETVSLGTLQIGVASAAAFKTLTLNSPGTSRIAFTALYGTKIVRLEEIGYGRIAFISNRDGNYEIYVMNGDGSGQTRLTNNPAAEWNPAWSPDGKQIAFHSNRDGNYEIYVMNADGSGQTRLTNNSADDGSPAWSPDGKRLAFWSARDGNSEIYVMNADGSGQTRLTNDSASDYSPAWSPDGRRIAFTREFSGKPDICVMNTDGSGLEQLTANSVNDGEPAWSPDGRHIVFWSDRDGPPEIYVMNPDGSGVTRLTNNGCLVTSPDWSPDGKRIAFRSDRAGNPDIYVMNADGSDQTNLTLRVGNDLQPAWCPAPSVVRSLIGKAGSDGGSNPPFGTQKPLVIVGLNADGLVSATTLGVSETNWPTLTVTALQNIGTDLAGVQVKGNNLRQVIEDMGRGLPARVWQIYGSPTTGGALIFFNGETGKVASVIAAADTALSESAAQVTGGRVVLRGSFTEVYSARDPQRNLASGTAAEIALNARTGEVTAVR